MSLYIIHKKLTESRMDALLNMQSCIDQDVTDRDLAGADAWSTLAHKIGNVTHYIDSEPYWSPE